MLGRLFRRRSEPEAIAASLYGAIVAQARSPFLYSAVGIADSVDGRFEMVVLHLILVLDRLQEGGLEEKAIGQSVFDLYCTDMDRSLRELGIGDLGVPKRMKKMTERFYGRAAAYRSPLAAGDLAALEDALGRNVFDTDAAPAVALAAYAIACRDALAAVPIAALFSAPPPFPDAADFAPESATI